MDTKDIIVLKFGGSSVADNLKLNVVAKKIIDLYNKNNKIVVVVSAQGKTTDNLLNQAKELSSLPNERELDTLVSTGEQISMSKLSILLNELGYESISLTGWQAGIYTSNLNQNSKIENIDTTRIEEELEKDKNQEALNLKNIDIAEQLEYIEKVNKINQGKQLFYYILT